MTETPLRDKIAEAIWEAQKEPGLPRWSRLDPKMDRRLKKEMLAMADAALDVILKEVAMPEYQRWRDTEEIGAIGACGNIVAKLSGAKLEI